MNKPYTQDQLDHYMEVGSDSRFEYCMVRQLMEENKLLRSDKTMLVNIIAMDAEGCEALVKAHRELEESHAELEDLLDGLTE